MIKSKKLKFDPISPASVVSLIAVTVVWCYLYYLNVVDGGVIVDYADGIAHFQLSRSALEHPKLFFDNWARPSHVAFSVFPAQLGFKYYVLAHVLLTVVNSYLMIRLGSHWNLAVPWLLPWWMVVNTAVLHVTIGGLTEPLYVFFALLTLSLLEEKKWFYVGLVLGLALIARHEAVLLILVAFFFALKSKTRNVIIQCGIAFFITLIGFSLFGVVLGGKTNLLWVFWDQPYGRNPNVYGAGTWSHFWDYRRLWASSVMVGAFVIAAMGTLIGLVKTKEVSIKLSTFIIASGTVLTHVVLWKFGLLGSLGLTRILAIAIPFMALSIHSLNSGAGIIVIVLFTGHAFQWYRDSPNTTFQKSVHQLVAEHELAGLHDVPESARIAAQWKLPLVLRGYPTEDVQRVVPLWELPPLLPSSALLPGDLLVWDNVTGFREGGLDEAICRMDPGLQPIDSVELDGVRLVVFQVVPALTDVLLSTKKMAGMLSGNGVWATKNKTHLCIRPPRTYGRLLQLNPNSPPITVKWRGSPEGQLIIRSPDGREHFMGNKGVFTFSRLKEPKRLLWLAKNGEVLFDFEAHKTSNQRPVTSN